MVTVPITKMPFLAFLLALGYSGGPKSNETGIPRDRRPDHPELFKECKRTKTGDFQVGHIYCELIPGDRITWFGSGFRKTGVVCAEGEKGERWDCIGREMKSVLTLVEPSWGSVQPTKLEQDCARKISELQKRKREIRTSICAQLGHEVDFTTNGIASVTNFLAECLSASQPGFYLGIHTRKWEHLPMTDRGVAQQVAEKRGRERFNDYQYDLDRFRSDALRLLKHEKITDEVARAFSLSRYELVKLRDWDHAEMFENIVAQDELFPDTLVLRHNLYSDKPVAISVGDEPGIVDRVSKFANRKLSDADAERAVLELYEVLLRAFESPDDILERVLPVCCEVMSENCDKLVMRLLFVRLGVEYKGEAKVLDFLKQVYLESDKHRSGIMTPNWMKEMQRLLEFDWSRRLNVE